MKIIKMGELPETKVYTATCSKCGTVFEFLQNEARLSYDRRDGNFMVIACPLCEKDVYANP